MKLKNFRLNEKNMFEQSGVLFLRDRNLNNTKKILIFLCYGFAKRHIWKELSYTKCSSLSPLFIWREKKINSLEILFHDFFFVSPRHLFLLETSFFPRHFTHISTPSLTKTSISGLMPFTYASNYSLFMTRYFPLLFSFTSK